MFMVAASYLTISGIATPGPARTSDWAIECCARGSQRTIERGVAGLRLHESILCVVNTTKQAVVPWEHMGSCSCYVDLKSNGNEST